MEDLRWHRRTIALFIDYNRKYLARFNAKRNTIHYKYQHLGIHAHNGNTLGPLNVYLISNFS